MPSLIADRISTSPSPKVDVPTQSSRSCFGWRMSLSFQKPHTVPMMPTGTLTQNTSRQSQSASKPPSNRPMNEPPMPASS